MISSNFLVDFCREEVYDTAFLNCYAFKRGTDVKDGIVLSFGNMVSGYPFMLDGVRFHNSECAYICGAFSDGTVRRHIALQRELAECTNGFRAKKYICRPNETIKRDDWKNFNIQWMLYVVWNKCIGNADFRNLLLSLPPDAIIIEDSTFQVGKTATVWGARNIELKKHLSLYRKALKVESLSRAKVKRRLDSKRLGEWSKIGCFVGQNVMGKILMACRDALRNNNIPKIDYELLQSANINLLGNNLHFNHSFKVA